MSAWNRGPILVLILVLGAALSAIPVQARGGEKITRSNWGEMVGFPPSPQLQVPGYSPGLVIDAGNAEEFRSILPKSIFLLVKKYGLIITTGDTKPYAPSDGYIAATNRYRGRAALVDIGDSTEITGLKDYQAGLPFPHPQSGRELAWNFFHRYNGDDGQHEFGVYWVSAKRGVERHEIWRWTVISNILHRTDIEPIPRLPRLARRNLASTSITETLFPMDKKGQMALYNLFDDPTKREGWIYIPAQKRTMRFTSDNHGEAWNNTDLFYEDIGGYSGRPEWMDWKILKETTLLAPMHAGVEYGKNAAEKTYDFKTWPHWNPRLKWQLRPVYVVELTPRLRKYPYSRQILYIDAESYGVYLKVAYDKKGALWKVLINATNASRDPKTKPLTIATSLVVDLQAMHATVFPWYDNRANIGVNPNLFSLTTLRKKAR